MDRLRYRKVVRRGWLLISESGPDVEYGDLGTKETFKNFELTAEFKQETGGNSGIFFRSSIEGPKSQGGRQKLDLWFWIRLGAK